jgi:hypothetical protein
MGCELCCNASRGRLDSTRNIQAGLARCPTRSKHSLQEMDPDALIVASATYKHLPDGRSVDYVNCACYRTLAHARNLALR